jgi:glycosyltransferase involved in cell wall biosynthesis
MMETRRVHPDLIAMLKKHAHRIIVPTEEWDGVNFAASGYPTDKISFVSPGVDVNLFKPDVTPMQFTNLRSFVFGVVGTFSDRKGMRELIFGACDAFTSKDDVTILLFCKYSVKPFGLRKWFGRKGYWSVKAGIERLIREHGTTNPPHIVYFDASVQECLMPSIMRRMSVVGMPSRGECFWMPGLEAAAMGIPIWNLDVGGHMAYMTPENSTLVKHDGWTPATYDMTKVCPYYEGMEFPSVDMDDLRFKMRWMVNHHRELQEKADRLRAVVLKKYSWETVGAALVRNVQGEGRG